MKYGEFKKWLEEVAEKYQNDKDILEKINKLQIIITEPLNTDFKKGPLTLGRILSG